jgi:hypothetical protein
VFDVSDELQWHPHSRHRFGLPILLMLCACEPTLKVSYEINVNMKTLRSMANILIFFETKKKDNNNHILFFQELVHILHYNESGHIN